MYVSECGRSNACQAIWPLLPFALLADKHGLSGIILYSSVWLVLDLSIKCFHMHGPNVSAGDAIVSIFNFFNTKSYQLLKRWLLIFPQLPFSYLLYVMKEQINFGLHNLWNIPDLFGISRAWWSLTHWEGNGACGYYWLPVEMWNPKAKLKNCCPLLQRPHSLCTSAHVNISSLWTEHIHDSNCLCFVLFCLHVHYCLFS